MANRYTNLTPSAYSPLTLEEIAMVPALKRKQHDTLLAQQEAVRTGLAKVDPLEVHYNKALELKKGIEGQMDTMATTLAEQGINQDMIGKTIALNRQYQDLVAPTGDIGRINAAKIEYNKQKEEFLKNTDAQKIGRERALALWNEKTKPYTGFDEQGRISNVTSQGVAAFQDYGQDLSRAHSILGETIKGLPTSGGYSLQSTPDGGTVFVNNNGERIQGDNARQVESAYQAFRDKWIAGEGAAYAADAGLGIDEDRIRNDFNAMLKSSDITKQHINASYNAPSASGTDSGDNQYEAIPDEAQVTETNDVADRVNNIGKLGAGSIGKIFTTKDEKGKNPEPIEGNWRNPALVNKPEDLLNPGELKMYNGLKKHFAGSDPNWKKMTEEERNMKIANEMQSKALTFSPTIMKVSSKSMSELLPGTRNTTDLSTIGDNMLTDAITGGGARAVYDARSGEKIDIDELRDNKKLVVTGFTMPSHLGQQKMEGVTSKQKVSPISAIMTDKNGIKRNVYVTRTAGEMETPVFKRMEKAHKVFNEVVENMGQYRKLSNIDGALKNHGVKYDPSITDGAPIIILKPDGSKVRMSLDDWQRTISNHNNFR